MRAIIEIPKGSTFKYEVDKKSGKIVIDRPLPAPLPYNYGYMEDTLYKDGDPLDVCVVGCDSIVPLAELNVVPIGVFICEDNGVSDDKIVAVVQGMDERSSELRLGEVRHYLSTYKPGFKVLDFKYAEAASEIYFWSKENYARSLGSMGWDKHAQSL